MQLGHIRGHYLVFIVSTRRSECHINAEFLVKCMDFNHRSVSLYGCLLVGLNAGLAAYPTWVDTLTALSQSRTPAYFTDYCQYSCECSRLPLEALHLGTISKVEINPFRSPLRKYCEEHDMPWYSNAFVYHLVYVS